MRNRFILGTALAVLMLACGGDPGGGSQTSNQELGRRVTKLEDDLHEAKRQLIAQQQAMQILNERLKTMEANVDKLAYGSQRQ